MTESSPAASLSGPWDQTQLDSFLDDTCFPLRLAVSMDDGYPVVVSLWFVREKGALWCATHKSAKLLNHLRSEKRVGFEIAPSTPPYYGCRGQADAALVPEDGERILRTVIPRYLGGTDSDLAQWLLSRADEEVAIRLDPIRFFTWDYRERMDG